MIALDLGCGSFTGELSFLLHIFYRAMSSGFALGVRSSLLTSPSDEAESSIAALTNLKDLCESYLSGNFNIEVIDVESRPDMTEEDQIIFTPTLLRISPLPIKRMSGALDDTQEVLTVFRSFTLYARFAQLSPQN